MKNVDRIMHNGEDDELSRRIIGCALEVHSQLGPGLLESTYEECLCYELSQLQILFTRQVLLPIQYKSLALEKAYKVDLLVSRELIVELKVIEKVQPVHKAQVRTYLRHARLRRGLIFNFNEESLKSGIHRVTIQNPLR